MLMLAILALGMLTFRIGKAAVLRSGAQTAADAAALAGARSIRDQLDRAGRDDGDLRPRARQRAGRARRRRRLRQAQRRAPDRLQDRGRRRARLGRHRRREGRPPKDDRRGAAKARARVELVACRASAAPGRSAGAAAAAAPTSRSPTRSGRSWREGLKVPPDCDDLYTLGAFLKAHGAIPPYENARLGDPPSPPGERSTTSWHYQCGNSGAIDLNYGGNEKAIIDSQIGWFHKLGFNTIWQEENHYDHVHINPGAAAGIDARRRRGRPAAAHAARGQARRLGRDLADRPGGGLRRRAGRDPVRPARTRRSPTRCATSSTATRSPTRCASRPGRRRSSSPA